MSPEHRFRFKSGEMELELAGDRDFIEAQLARWMPHLLKGETPREAPTVQVDVTPAEDVATDGFRRVPADFTPRVTVSLSEFMAFKQAVAPLDRVTVTGYYMEKYGRRDRFTAKELEEALAALDDWGCASVDEPFELAVAAGYFEALRDGTYTLTYKGQTYVQNGLSN
jgi:hypothetical protein